ncbi:MAG: hemolysin D, partial [Pirellulaceae bacterium]|nr:hemolysin D [Pirellulaceae bacterium]
LLNVRTIVYLGFALGIVKVIHELGHALTCRRVGGECHELGFMLLVFAPCLYVNVTDTWMATSKWKRAAVASAGIVVEVVMAAAAYFVWRFSEPGFLNSLSFSIMAVCSVGTIVFNGNPLLRFDGYYVFSDLLETPNLGEQSSSWLWRGVVRTLFGVDTPKRDFGPPPRTWLLASYSIAALAYRAVVLAVILWGVHQTLSPLGLETLAFALGALVIIGMLLRPATRVYRFVTSPGVRTVKRLNLAVTGAIAVTLLALALWAPLPHRIRGSAIARPKDASRVFVTHAGRLLESVAIGQRVDAGEPLAKLENMELAAEILELRGRRDEQALQVDQLIHQQIVDPRAEDQLPSARQALEDLNRQLEKKLADSAGLQIKAPTAGVVLPAPLVRREPAQNQLTSWSGSPLH